ncbi:TRAP transporter small permease [Maribacter sp. 1_MG-2023]|uniref:TRAP transporter small permease n=1 Tax=Maribacter sp. 1_MG-2023 TaxID=3062677 RepID=UPI0026E26EDF|nr:TRAP transporter small permease subunit [Maribacter sp. 1_MG-2023]MDO6472815.1 TRAP transporter small permease subunit [Maribacter sp. 1_MG-2023]
MKSLIKTFRKLMIWGTITSTLLFIGITLIQIYGRFFMVKAPSWSEEAARVAFIYAIAFASGLAVRGSYYVDFGFLAQKLKPRLQKRLTYFVWGVTVIFIILFTYYAIDFLMLGLIEKSPSLKFKMAISFSGIAIMGLSILVHLLDQKPKN